MYLAWSVSPDGAHIAAVSQPPASSAELRLFDTRSGSNERVPDSAQWDVIWSRDGQYLYFSRRPTAGGNDDIVRKRADVTGTVDTIINGFANGTDEAVYQAALAAGDDHVAGNQGFHRDIVQHRSDDIGHGAEMAGGEIALGDQPGLRIEQAGGGELRRVQHILQPHRQPVQGQQVQEAMDAVRRRLDRLERELGIS